VTRDRGVRQLAAAAAAEVGGEAAAAAGSAFLGTGYPSDPATQAYMEQRADKVFGYKPIVRFSWETTTRALAAAGAVKVGAGRASERGRGREGDGVADVRGCVAVRAWGPRALVVGWCAVRAGWAVGAAAPRPRR
jgi:hypothetical protein